MAATYLPGAVRPANPSRRAIMGALAAAPALTVLAVPSEAAMSEDSALFHERFAAFERANAAFLQTCKMPNLADEIGDQACLDAGNAYDVMIATPASDFRCLGKKLDALFRWSSGSEIPNDEVAMLAADARRLLRGRADR
jgi:hypothetical protein